MLWILRIQWLIFILPQIKTIQKIRNWILALFSTNRNPKTMKPWSGHKKISLRKIQNEPYTVTGQNTSFNLRDQICFTSHNALFPQSHMELPTTIYIILKIPPTSILKHSTWKTIQLLKYLRSSKKKKIAQ